MVIYGISFGQAPDDDNFVYRNVHGVSEIVLLC